MIPKIIHYCWLSGDEYPESVKECLDSWKVHLKDYEIWLWDKNRFDVESTFWTKEAYDAKKYAFAADYIRLYALYNYGGIYLDSDVLVYKSFDDLLKLPYFIGEDYVGCFEPAIIGCAPRMPWIKRVLQRYDGLHFVDENGDYNIETLPAVFRGSLYSYRFERVSDKEYEYEDGVIKVFPSDCFNSRDYVGIIKNKNSYCSHKYLGSWCKESGKIKSFIKSITPRPVVNLVYKTMFSIFHRENILRMR